MKTVAAAAVALLLGIAGIAGYAFHRYHSLNDGFSRVQFGDTENRVTGLMGEPDRVVFKGDGDFWSAHIEDSAREYHYTARILPETWIIGFNPAGVVVYRNHNLM